MAVCNTAVKPSRPALPQPSRRRGPGHLSKQMRGLATPKRVSSRTSYFPGTAVPVGFSSSVLLTAVFETNRNKQQGRQNKQHRRSIFNASLAFRVFSPLPLPWSGRTPPPQCRWPSWACTCSTRPIRTSTIPRAFWTPRPIASDSREDHLLPPSC